MGRSNRLSLDEIREVFRIVQETIDYGTDPTAWRQRMLARTCKLIGSLWGTSFLIPMAFDPKDLKPPIFVYSPMPRPMQRLFTKRFRAPNVADDPVTPVVAGLANKPVTLTRRQMVSDHDWYNSGSYRNWRKPMGTDDIIHSHDPLPQFGVMSVMGFARRFGEPPFAQREVKIVELLRSELNHRWTAARSNQTARAKLTVRHEQLLGYLKGPMSEKEIARYMDLSPHTIHNYVKEVYRRLKVTTRTELQHRLWSADNTSLPKLGYRDL